MAKACALIFQNSVIAVKMTREIETEIRMLITKGGNLNLSQKEISSYSIKYADEIGMEKSAPFYHPFQAC